MSRAAFPALEREYNEREERLDVARASRLRHQEEMAAVAPITTKVLDLASADDVREVLQTRIIELENERAKLVDALRSVLVKDKFVAIREMEAHALLRELGERS